MPVNVSLCAAEKVLNMSAGRLLDKSRISLQDMMEMCLCVCVCECVLLAEGERLIDAGAE